MKAQYYFKWGIAVLLLAFVSESFSQQTRPAKRRPANTSAYGNDTTVQNNNSAYGNADTTRQRVNQSSGYGNTGNKTSSGIDTTLPITVIKSSGSGLNDSAKMSLRNDAPFEQNLIKERTPLAYENIREDDAVYRVRVWREIDAREKMNLPFRYAAEDDNGSMRFISILLRAIKNGDVTAFSGDDDRFTTPITPDQAFAAFGGGLDTNKQYDDEGNVKGYIVRPKAVDPDSIHTFRLKEEWVFDKESSRLFVRILGIAPVIPFKLSSGQNLEGSEHPTWWIYYPDLRPVLAKSEAYNPKNYAGRMTWEELFESRMFSSYITKSTIDNAFNLDFSQVYPNNTLFRLLEGENVKDKIFNYEQSLWSY